MKKFLSLFLVIILVGCGGGSGGTSNSTSNPGTVTPDEPTVIPDDPNIPGIDDELTAAEQLFGQGNGTGATPTTLLTRTDALGFDYLSFGAWGNVYDIKYNEDPTPNIAYFDGQQGGHYSFITNSENEYMTSWNTTANASVANRVFTGPAIMHNVTKYDSRIDYPTCQQCTTTFKHNPDYGTLQLAFGHDITNYILTFKMNNPENNLVLTLPEDANGLMYLATKFNEQRDKVYIFHRTEAEREDPYGYIEHYKEYQGYGIKQ